MRHWRKKKTSTFLDDYSVSEDNEVWNSSARGATNRRVVLNRSLRFFLILHLATWTGLLCPQCFALSPGDIAFVGFDADIDDGFAFVALADIAPGQVIHFRDDEWNGVNDWVDSNEGDLTWTVVNPLPKGGVICVSNVNSGVCVSEGEISGFMNLSSSAEGLFAYEGSHPDNPSTFLAAIANDGSVPDTFGNLNGTGLVLGDTAIQLSGGQDVSEYVGLRTALNAAAYRKQIADTGANWISENAVGDQSTNGIPPDVPFNKSSFFVSTSDSKWHQPPDVTPNGVDVGGSNLFADVGFFELGDDFLCTQTGPITGICIYASWFLDNVDPNADFELSIWSDNPTNQSVPFSTPSNLLCQYTFEPHQYVVSQWTNVTPGEWFYDPYPDMAPGPDLAIGMAEADTVIWKYDFVIDSLTQCVVTQQEGQVYWITLTYRPELFSNNLFGWKSSTNDWNDDAVWRINNEPSFLTPWVELYYPANHPYAGQSIDLAFEVRTPGMDSAFDTWVAQFNLPPGQDGPDDDPDGDDMTNLEEWIAGTDPGDANDAFEIIAVDRLSGSNCVWWRIGTNTEITTPFALWRATNLANQVYEEVASGILRDPSGTNVYYDTSAPADPVMYRTILPANHP
jgi:hypothetical protein